MIIDKVAAISGSQKIQGPNMGKSFKLALDGRRLAHEANPGRMASAVNSLVVSHEKAARAMNSFMEKGDLSPHKLLKIQFKTSHLLLREQMLCKTAESATNSLKSFSQMQV